MADPAPSTPLTDNDLIGHITARQAMEHVRTMLDRLTGRKPQMEHVNDIKLFCRLLSVYNISRVRAFYDGSGDSGDFDSIEATVQPTPEEITNNAVAVRNVPNVLPPREGNVSLEAWLSRNVFDKPGACITHAEYETFVDNLFALLPSGWEINDGSFGEINIDVASERITLEHNERYTEVRTDNFSY